MKMKKIYAMGLSVLMLSSCIKDDMNIDPKKSTKVPAETLFSNAQRNLVDNITSTSVNVNIFRLITQQWQETTYLDESQYDLTTRNIPQTFWEITYRDVLKDLKEAKNIIGADAMNQDLKANKLAQIDLTEVYAYSVLVNTFGNVPYSQALDADNLYPKYDEASVILTDLLKRIDQDLANLKTTAGGLGSADVLYKGDVAKWRKFANSLKLKLGMLLVDANDAAAKKAVSEAVAGGVFTSNADNAVFKYLDSPPNTNPIWVDVIQSNRNDFVVCNTIVTQMNALNDPRRASFFASNLTSNGDVVYKGGFPGESSNYDSFSHIGDMIVEPDYSSTILSYAEVEFYLAEAVARGYAGVTGTAVEHYNKAITASMLEWGVSVDQIAIYLPTVPLDVINYKKSIGEQKAIALYNRGYDAWVEWRRLDFPKLTPAASAQSGIPVRFTYPAREQTLNTESYMEAATAIGGDRVETKVFWDKTGQ